EGAEPLEDPPVGPQPAEQEDRPAPTEHARQVGDGLARGRVEVPGPLQVEDQHVLAVQLLQRGRELRGRPEEQGAFDVVDGHPVTRRIPARAARGMRAARFANATIRSSRTAAWQTADIRVRAPALIPAEDRTITPVTGSPPKKGTTRLATPCPISSWSLRCPV